MADVSRDRKVPGPGGASSLWLLAAISGMSIAAAAGYGWRPHVVQASTMKQALYEFDEDDMPAAAAAFRTLANQGNADAEYWYGHALEKGLGLPADPRLALQEYHRAWDGGVAAAGRRLGELDIDGNLGAPDFARGRALLTAAAEHGDVRAALDLGGVLRNGIGGPADPVGAYAWLEVASLGGNAEARIERDRLLPSLTPDQQAAAARKVAAWQAAHAHTDAHTPDSASTNAAKTSNNADTASSGAARTGALTSADNGTPSTPTANKLADTARSKE